ncbi:MAG: hypothetical protein ACI9X4_002283 [Glaciecola sp.]|jgi:hypothetical protein
MRFFRIFSVLLALFLVGSVDSTFAQRPDHKKPNQERVQRWNDMEGPRKQDMRRRYDRLHRMDAGKRKDKMDRVQHLQEIMVEIYGKMDAPTKARVDAMKRSERSRLLGHLAVEEARSRSREARLILGSKNVQNSEGGPREGVSHEERKAIHGEWLSKARLRLEGHIQKNGLPKGLSQKKWDNFRKEEGRKFGHSLRKLGERYPELIEVLGPPPGRRAEDSERWELHQAMRLPRGEHMKLVGPRDEATHKNEMVSRRKRVMVVLKSHKSLSEERLKEMKGLSDEEFMNWMHRQLRPRRGPGGKSGRGPGPGMRPEKGPDGGPRMGPPPGHKPPKGRRGPAPGDARERGPDGGPRTGPPRGHKPPKGRRGPAPGDTRDRKGPPGPRISPHPGQRRGSSRPVKSSDSPETRKGSPRDR